MKGKIEYTLIRTFIPSKDHELSRDFYKDLGFEISWEDKDLVIFGQGRQTFFLQRYYNKVWAENFMMQAFVKDLEALFNHVKELKKMVSEKGGKPSGKTKEDLILFLNNNQ